MNWEDLKVLLSDEYCPRDEIQILEHEPWSLTMKGSDIKGYTTMFNDISILCLKLVTPEYKKVER